MSVLALLVLLLPLAGFLINALFGRALARQLVGWVGAGSVGLAFGSALAVLVQVAGGQQLDHTYFTWWNSAGFEIPFNLYIDPLSFQYLDGTEIDYVEGLHGSGFKFNNPNVKGTCGCGSSFSA